MCVYTVPWLLRTTLLLLLGLLLPLPLTLIFLLPLLLPRRQFVCGWSCALISLIISCVPSHARCEITATRNFTYMQTLVDSERFLIDDWSDNLYENTFNELRQDLRCGHVLGRATVEGQKQYVYTRFCPSSLAMGRHLLRTVKCREDGNCGYHSLLNGICHLRGQVRTNTAVSTSIVCQRCSSFQIRWRYQSRRCLPLQHTSFIFGTFASTRVCPFVLPLHRRLYIYCALRQTPHGHMRIGVLGSVCVCMYSVCVLRLRNTFPVSCTPCSGVHYRATRPQHIRAFLIAAYATLPYSLLVQATKYEHSNAHIPLLKARIADVLVDHVTAGLSGRTVRTQ